MQAYLIMTRWAAVPLFVLLFCLPSHADLVAHWPLNEGSGEIFRDRAGGNDGFLPSAELPTWTDNAAPTGFANPYALDFSGSGFVDTPYEGIEGTNPRTISAWVKTDTTAGQAIVAYGDLSDGAKWHFRVNPDGGGRVMGAIRTEVQGGNQTGDTSIADGQWHHVVSVFPNGAEDNIEVIHYVDGALEGETGTTDEFVDTLVGLNLVSIGARRQNGFENFMNGSIDDVRIYDRELSEAEIMALTSAPTNDGLVAHWPFDDGPDSNMATETIAGNNGMLLTNPDLDSVSVEWVNDGPPGIQDNSVEFTGDLGPSYIETPFEGITGDGARTITLWAKAEQPPDHSAMVAWGDAAATSGKWHFRIDQTNGNALRTEFQGGQNFAETDVADGEWHFVASVFPEGGEGADIIHYLDGEIDEQLGGASLPIDTVGVDDGGLPVHIGWAAGHANRWFVGQLADVRIYDEALDEETLRKIMMGETDLPGDYNSDGVVDAKDADEQAVAMNSPDPDLAKFDENNDMLVDNDDRVIWAHEHAGTWIGDANFDLVFDSGDLVDVFGGGKYDTGEMAGWADGDWNGDMLFDSGDLVAAFSDGGYGQGRYEAAAIPEPSSLTLLLLSVLGMVRGLRRQR